jgi:hypothetical protein
MEGGPFPGMVVEVFYAAGSRDMVYRSYEGVVILDPPDTARQFMHLDCPRNVNCNELVVSIVHGLIVR